MSFSRYPEYKDSGVRWLGTVPLHWDVSPIKRNYAVVGGSTPQSETASYWDGDIVWVTPADLSRLRAFEIHQSLRTITHEGLNSCGTSLVPEGSIVLSTRAPIGSLGIAATELCTNQGCKSLVPTDRQESRYLAYLLSIVTGELNVRGRGTTFLELSADELGAFKVGFPTLDEQVRITAFLDRETAKIDALVAEQEKLITLLKEKRQAVISQAVTKGLDPTVPMKDSGVEWLGWVPAHWIVMPIRLAANLESGHTPSRSRADWWEDCTIPWFTLADVWQIRDGGVDVVYETKEQVSELGLANSSARLLPKGTVMLSRTASVGFSAIMGVDMATTQDFANWVCGESLNPSFLLTVLRSMKSEFHRLMMGSTHNTIYMPDIQSLRFALPPLNEQAAIVEYTKDESSRFDGLIAEAGKAVELLRERRTALISAAVTGQIDVRAR